MGLRLLCGIGLMLCTRWVCGQEPLAMTRWESLLETVKTDAGQSGTWTRQKNLLRVTARPGACLEIPWSPPAEYDVRVTFTRLTGQHSVGMVLSHRGDRVAFEVDAWGQHLGGFQNVDGKSLEQNVTRREKIRLNNNQRHTLTVEVRQDSLRGLLDDQEIARLPTADVRLSLPDVWGFPKEGTFGLLAWDCDVDFHTIEFRVPLKQSGRASHPAGAPEKSKPDAQALRGTQAPASMNKQGSNKQGSRSDSALAARRQTTRAKSDARDTQNPVSPPKQGPAETTQSRGHVLIVIANHHFFYREYSDPRRELERAGYRITVAAGRKGACHPHDGSGQGPDGGVVNAELALRDVLADDYDAILFSGGWGASAYQYAFNGRYQDASYNGERTIKEQTNRVINDFLKQDKYVCALCNGTSVLAWARVDGKSPLQGKRVCAPVRPAPPGVYQGRPAQPSCRWHVEVNGGRLLPSGSIGQAETAADDIVVDGRIITGEDDISALEMGRKLAEVLQKSPR